MRRQCGWCGAPLRDALAGACKFCGTAIPPEPQVTSGPALCVCSVIAAWRCVLCDTAVCEQHRNRFWPGQARGNIRLADATESAVWNETVDADATLFRAGATEACTVCRSELAGSLLERYRSIPTPQASNAFERMLALAQAGVWTTSLFSYGDATEVLSGLLAHQQSRGVGETSVATKWKVRAGAMNKVTSAAPVRVFPVSTAGIYLVFKPATWQVSGPFKGSMHATTFVPEPNNRDMVRRQYAPAVGTPKPNLDYAVYSLSWRQVRLGSTFSDLGLASYASIFTPLTS